MADNAASTYRETLAYLIVGLFATLLSLACWSVMLIQFAFTV